MIRILLLEDDPNLAKTLQKYLQRHAFDVDLARNGEEALDLTFHNRYDIYLFDINVSLLNGIDLLGQLRESGDTTPTIIISALTDIASVTKGFIAGADDYLKKPFDPEELLIRIRAKTRTIRKTVPVGDLEVDMQKESVYRNGEQIYLGEVQTRLLMTLLHYRPDPVPKEILTELLEKPSDLALRVNISKLKKQYNIPIRSVRRVGYQII